MCLALSSRTVSSESDWRNGPWLETLSNAGNWWRGRLTRNGPSVLSYHQIPTETTTDDQKEKKIVLGNGRPVQVGFQYLENSFQELFFFFLLLLTSLYLPFKFIGHNQYGVLQPYSENIKKYNSSGDKRGFLQKNNQKKKIKPDQIKPNRTKPNQIKIGNGTAFLQLLSSDDWNWL